MHPQRPHGASHDDVDFRLLTLRTGVWPTLFVCAFSGVYCALTWGDPHRGFLAWLVGVSFVLTFAMLFAPLEPVVRGRFREVFFVGWTVTIIGIISAACLADRGVEGPMVYLLFLPLAYASLSYPPKSMAVIVVLNLGAFSGLVLASPEVSGPRTYILGCALLTAAWICSWQTRNHDSQRRELAQVSRTDTLTGALNRRGFEERFASELSRARREGSELTLALLDLDGFKAVNDTHGHHAGDDLLRWVSHTLADELRASDALGRVGGDEFALVIGHGAPAAVLERTLARLAERIEVSAGAATFPLDGPDYDTLYQRADAALYERKEGRRRGADFGRELSWAAALATAVDERMAVSHRHSEAVATYAAAIAERLGWDEGEVGLLRVAAMLHDVGKVRVPERILRKSGPLDEADWAEIMRHPVAGAEIIGAVEGLEPIVAWIRHSHERVDGHGYPAGLAGDEIPVASRILLVADAFDAMTSDRAYRAAMSAGDALAELRRCAGAQFDARCVEALEAHLERVSA